MSYQVLARKWRPRSFKDMVGQTHVLQALSNALDNDRLHHAYLFTGSRGVGKTTLGRILAKCFNCEEGVSSSPCGQCSACICIDEGRFVDLIEVDAASRAKVDETRELMDNVQYAPSVGRYKIYLIDEVHMFSNHSFNALLKTLEEPPPHVKFLLATTEAKKVPVTILSRCLQFNLKLLSVDQIEGQLEKILAREAIENDEASRHLLAVAAEGSMRDALSLLDQAISYGGGRLEEAQVRAMLGTIDKPDLISLLDALITKNGPKILSQVQNMSEHHLDYDSVLTELIGTIHQIAVQQVLGDQAGEHVDEGLQKLVGEISREEIQLFYQIALNGRRDLALSPDPRRAFEMVLIRMLAFTPAEAVSRQAVEPSSNTSGNPESRQQTGTSDVGAGHRQAVSTIEAEDNPELPKEISAEQWRHIVDDLPLSGLARELADHCGLKLYDNERITLVCSPRREHLLNASQKDRFVQALRSRFHKDIRIEFLIEEPANDTPAVIKDREQSERQKAAENAIEQDPNIQTIKEMFDAEVDESSIRPVSNDSSQQEERN